MNRNEIKAKLCEIMKLAMPTLEISEETIGKTPDSTERMHMTNKIQGRVSQTRRKM